MALATIVLALIAFISTAYFDVVLLTGSQREWLPKNIRVERDYFKISSEMNLKIREYRRRSVHQSRVGQRLTQRPPETGPGIKKAERLLSALYSKGLSLAALSDCRIYHQKVLGAFCLERQCRR